jgi:hypothetical protein
MSFYIVQEVLAVLLVLAGLMGTVLAFGIAVILLQEGIRQASVVRIPASYLLTC